MKRAQRQLHQLTDHVSALLGFVEEEQYSLALKMRKLVEDDLEKLRQTLLGEILPECERCAARLLAEKKQP